MFRRLKAQASATMFNANDLINDLKDGFGVRFTIVPAKVLPFVKAVMSGSTVPIDVPVSLVIVPKEDAK